MLTIKNIKKIVIGLLILTIIINLSLYINSFNQVNHSVVSKLKFENSNFNNNIITTVTGSVTNNENATNFNVVTTYNDKDGSLITTESINIGLIKKGETKQFKSLIINFDISNATYKTKLYPI